jgi:vitamin B12 transporter
MRQLARYTAALIVALASLAPAQSPPAHLLRGTVTSQNGAPVGGAEAFLLESLESSTSDSAGRFTLVTRAQGSVTLVVRRIGYAPATLIVAADTTAELTVTLHRQAAVLVPMTVQAGAYRAGNEHGMTLTSLEVVTTPGATADVARAMQTLPGVQNVDEGTALFVRGGDASETKVLLNDVVMLSPYNYETPTGTYTVSVNPFLLDGIFFSSGGFGARYGNVLSGVADLRTAGRPAQSSITAVAGLASVSAQADLAPTTAIGIHATAARTDLDPLFRVNGATRSYSPVPNGTDLSGSVIYQYRPTAELKTFAIDRRSAFGVGVNDPSYDGGYTNDVHTSMVQAHWQDLFGNLAATASTSYELARRNEAYGAFELGNDERWSQLFTQLAWTASERFALRGGGDAEWRDSRFIGSIPSTSADVSPGARVTEFDSRAAGSRAGEFIEGDLRLFDNVRLTPGIRSDYSSFTRTRTADPRISAAYKAGAATFTAAAGEFHQVADPLYYASGIGSTAALAPMSARHFVIGAQLGEDRQMARLELYDKRYRDLVGLTADKSVVGGGTGDAHGADLFLRHSIWPFAAARLTYSFVDSRRTDPNTGAQARAPYDITHSITLVFDQALPAGWSFSSAFRYDTGKPYSPVVGAAPDSALGIWVPQLGPPESQRMPAYLKTDIALSRITRPWPRTSVVYFASLDNIFDRVNLYEYTYNSDYSRRIPVRSLFNRSLYFGASLTRTEN